MNNADVFGIFKKVAKLAKDPNNGCRIVVSQRHFALSPRYLGRLKKGAMETLQSEIGRYSESLCAVPLAYCNLQLLQPTGNILDDQPFIHFNVTFRAVVFQPTMGSVLKCTVNEYAGDHISCLVHNWFNLSLPLHDPSLEQRLPRGSKVQAKVVNILAKNGILAIQATPTGDRFPEFKTAADPLIVPKVEPSSDQEMDTLLTTGPPKKQKHDSGFGSDPDETRRLLGKYQSSQNDGETGKKKKKKKKKKERGEKRDQLDGQGVAMVTGVKKEREDPDRTIESMNVQGEKKKKKTKRDEEHSTEEMKPKMEECSVALVDLESEKKKKKKKQERRYSDEDNCEGVKPEEHSLDDSLAGVEGNESRHSAPTVVIKKEIESDDGMDVEDGQKRKKKKQKRKELEHALDADAAEISGRQNSEENPIKSEDFGNQKRLKRGRSHSSGDVNGSGDHIDRTTQNDVCGTVDEVDGGSPPKKKKKKHKK